VRWVCSEGNDAHPPRGRPALNIVIILPTYNEKENIRLLLDALQAQFQELQHDVSILVVDDNSPDGTADEVREAQTRYPNLHLLTGRKEGLGAAYIRGMTYALDTLHADALVQMDADFSHKCEDVPRLIRALEEGADLVIGSRYVAGGKIPEDWGWIRVMNSRWGNRAARYIAGLRQIRDCTAGFRAIRASLLRKITLDDLNVQGYAFQVAMLNKAMTSKAVVKEVPVEFVDRAKGHSKLGLRDLLEFIVNVWWIRLSNSKTFLKFITVGAIGTVINLSAFSLMIFYGLNRFIASPIAIEVSIISNYVLNNFYTFSNRDTKYNLYLRGLMFNAVSFVSLGVSYSTFVILTVLFPHAIPQLHQALGIVPATLVNYFLNAYWTFKT
jgi:dolichol-phosphate mannosyltransferase